MTIYLLDGRQMTDKPCAHAYLRRALPLPPYYGNNLDALNDCLAELPSGAVVVMTSIDAMREALGAYGDRLILVLENAARAGFIQFIRARERGEQAL